MREPGPIQSCRRFPAALPTRDRRLHSGITRHVGVTVPGELSPALDLAQGIGDLLFGELRFLHRSSPVIEDRDSGGILYVRLPTFLGRTSKWVNLPLDRP